MITNRQIVTEALAVLIELRDDVNFPLEESNEDSKNYAIDFLINDEMREYTFDKFSHDVIMPMMTRFTNLITKSDRICFIPQSVQVSSGIKINFNNVELALIESYDKDYESQRISIQMWINKK